VISKCNECLARYYKSIGQIDRAKALLSMLGAPPDKGDLAENAAKADIDLKLF
jgi:hypothetical protein